MTRTAISLFICLCFSQITFAQPESFSKDDMEFFQKTAQQYERWLQSVGLNQIMTVDKIKLKDKDPTELELHLKMNTNDLDTAVAQWKALRQKMSEGKPDTTILETLFIQYFCSTNANTCRTR